MTEELASLISAVANGDDDAFQQLQKQYTPLIHSMSERFLASFSGAENNGAIGLQDLEQEARLALYRAAKTFDLSKDSVTFGLYAKVCIRNALISMWRKSVSAARSARKVQLPTQEKHTHDPLYELVSYAETDALKARIRTVLSPYENRIFEQYISGRSVKNISLHMKKTEKSVSNALYRIRVKIKGLLSD